MVITAVLALTTPALAAGEGAPRPADRPLPTPPTRSTAWVAHVTHPTVARRHPSRHGRRVATVRTEVPWTGGPTRLLVLDARRNRHGEAWLRVRLGTRPNTASGWIAARFAEVERTPWRVVVDRSDRSLTVLNRGRVVKRAGAVVGTGATPTPLGLFALFEHARQPRGASLGPWALHLTAHSEVVHSFDGGAGRVAIHGRAGRLAQAPLGSAASHGCVRVDNTVIAWMARHLAAGTPVEVRA